MTELASLLPLEIPEPSPALALLQDRAGEYARASKAANTLRSCRTDLADFQAWCEIHALPALPASPTTIALHISALAQAGRKVATIEHRLAALSQAHQLAGYSPSPTSQPEVRITMAGIRRSLGTAQEGKAPLGTAELRRLVRLSGPTPLPEARDRALFLVGFAAGLRRSELVALDVRDLEESEHGLVVHLRRSKTDQEGAGEQRGVPMGQHPETCPVRALRHWLQSARSGRGRCFEGSTATASWRRAGSPRKRWP